MNVVILAGGELTPEDPLFPLIPEHKPKNKAYLPLDGKPMLQWVLDALAGSQYIDRMILVGVDAQSGFTAAKTMVFLPDQGGIVENIMAGVRYSAELDPQATHTLVSSADIPTLRSEMVDWVIENRKQLDVDILYHVITDETMETRFPGSNRTFAPLKGMRVCGGDLNIISHRVINEHTDLWERLTASRKNVLQQAAIFGPRLLFALLFRWYDLDQVASYLSNRLGLTAKAVVSPYAELGMDVDKPHQYELISNVMSETN
ncbi:nucleotidyltransferase family protein [bacterium]|nr:nucleotidyltransferase family protein [bacterium]MCB2179191.1 nucleotidyltransferase family protein [bacterium]